MRLSKESFRKMSGAGVVTAGTLIVLAVVLVIAGTGAAAGKPKTVAELALYKGADRQQILEEGARKEGTISFYTIHLERLFWVNAFKKRYPYIKVLDYRTGTSSLVTKVLEENKVGKHSVDVLELSQAAASVLQAGGILQPFYSPNLAELEEDGIREAPGGGVFLATYRLNPVGVGYNKTLITEDQLPKTYQDLLDPKWKGKITISGTNTGVQWIGTILSALGEDFVKRLAQQEIQVHMVSGGALFDMIVAGEYPFSPTLYRSHAVLSKKMGAAVDWVPLEPTYVVAGQMALDKHALHPHAGLLFMDFVLSKQSAELVKSIGMIPTRKDMTDLSSFKKFYGTKSVEETFRFQKIFNRLFLKR
ncbi:ABC transporter substrate-binding protein [Thermodesulfobacteriota bacterium]